jgi:bifunctional non-homologous end joining protein LigD
VATSNFLFVGKVQQGLNPANGRALLKLLQPLATDKCPFANLPTPSGGRRLGPGHWGESVTADEMADHVWLRPEIEAEIKFVEWTAGNVLRHAELVAPG